MYSAIIDKLSPSDYSLDEYYMQDGRLNMFITVKKSFKNGVVSLYRTAVARLLQTSNTATLMGTF